MRFTFENQGTNTYLVYEIGAGDALDTMSLGMLTNNNIPGFAAAAFTQMDTSRFIKYNVSAKVSVSQLFSGTVNKKRLIGVFTGIVDAMLAAEDYMLDTDNLLLDLDYIFADVSTCETVVICLPVMNSGHKNPELGMFFKSIIFNTQFDQAENCDHVAQILNYLNSAPVLSLGDFKAVLEKIEKAEKPAKAPPMPKAAAEPVRAAAPAAPAPQPVVTGAAVKPAPQPQAPKYENVQTGAGKAYAVPPKPAKPAKPEKSKSRQKPQTAGEKQMSMFYLLQHYSKENAAIYKEQQKAKKERAAAAPSPQPAPPRKAAPNAGFAIPGKQEPANAFAVPGQPSPIAQQPAAQSAQPVKAEAPLAPQPAPVYEQPAQTARPISFGETTVLGAGIGETTVLGAAVEGGQISPHLIRTKTGEKIPLNKPVFRIGKERSYVDYFISDNTAISRSHANIVNHDGEFFVVDTNSTNHTYVNGGMIPSNVETRISHGTAIRMANEDFEFRLY